jgi:hypothetical protein
MIAHAVSFHGSADAMSQLLLAGSYNAYIGTIPDEIETPVRYGDLLNALQLSDRGGLIIALRPRDGGELFNPSKDLLVASDTGLVYLAEGPLLEAPS